MAEFTVTTSADSGAGSLRQAIDDANASVGVADTIVFAAGLEGAVIATGGFVITDDVVIDGDVTGDNKADVTLDRGGTGTIFKIGGANVDLLSLTLANGATFGVGGAIYISGGSLDISDTTIRNSSAAGDGGAIYAVSSALTLTNSLLTGNSSSSGFGGALRMVDGAATLINTTIHGNTANSGAGGGIATNSTAELTLVNSTVTGNTASSIGGISSVLFDTLKLYNTVVADNTGGATANIGGGSGLAANVNNFIGTSPGLGALADHGGTTLTRDILTGSALIDTGSNAAPGLPATDANGNDRTVGTVDIGATERQLVVTNTNDSGAGSLRQAILDANANADFSVIQFAENLALTTINVGALGQFNLNSDIRIDGDVNRDGKADIAISGVDTHRIFFVSGAATDVTLESLTLTQGNAGAGNSGGAVVASGAGSLKIIDTTVSGSAAGFGGGIASFNTALTMANSLVTGNSAVIGGGIYSQDAGVTLQNTTVTGNTATSFGGGISSFNGSLGLLNTTVAGNRADADGASADSGGGLRMAGTNYSVLYNSVVADNFSGTDFVEHNVLGTISFAGNSALGARAAFVTDGSGNLVNIATAGLGTLQDNGGTVRTLAPDTGSVLIGAGSTSRIAGDSLDIDHDGNTTEALPLDGRGGPRQVGQVDIGAVEARDALVVSTAADELFNGGNLAAETADGGGLSLREALAFANADAVSDTILFAAGLAGQQLTLTGIQLMITNDLVIDGDSNGDNKADIAISGNNASRIFDTGIGANVDLDILSLTLRNGKSAAGAAIKMNSGSLDIRDTTFEGNTALQTGGAIYAGASAVSIVNALFTNNTAVEKGGAIYVDGGTTTLVNTTVHGNTATGYAGSFEVGGKGGGIYARTLNQMTLVNSTVTGNSASDFGTATGRGGCIDHSPGSTLTIINTVVAGNAATDTADVFGGALGFNSFFGSAVGGVTNGSNGNIVGGATGLGNLLDNGGSTLTRSPLDGSALIGTGGSSSIQDLHDLDGDGNRLEGLPLDARGQPRINGVRDIGAVEQIVDETISGTAGSDTILGGLGNDVLRGRAGTDTINGGGGNDTADWQDATAAIVFTLTAAGGGSTANVAGIGVDTLLGIENLIGGNAADNLTGNGAQNRLDGGSGGVDTLAGAGGNDTYIVGAGDIVTEAAVVGTDTVQTALGVYTLTANVERLQFTSAGPHTGKGNSGSNTLNGNAGDDKFLVDAGGNDIFSGGLGSDSMDFRLSAIGAQLNFATNTFGGAAAGDTFASIEKFFGSDTAADTMTAGTGRVDFSGFGGADTLTGGISVDKLSGGDGIDTLNGGANNDTIQGGKGNDILTGGAGKDLFNYVETVALGGFGHDTITDFQDGLDRIKIDTPGVAAGFGSFTIAGNGTATVTVTLTAAPANFLTLQSAGGAMTITAADFLFF